MNARCFLLALVGVVAPLAAQAPVWQMQNSGVTAGLRGIFSVEGTVAWASGAGGTVLRTLDGGAHWQPCATPDADKDGATLDFRGIQAWDADTAIVMASGPGPKSRLYKTTDGCKTWKLLFTNPDRDGFWDAVSVADQNYIMVLGDPIAEKFVVLSTADGGANWQRDTDYGLQCRKSEGAFAASNSSLSVDWVDGSVIFGAGGPGGARVFQSHGSSKSSQTWRVESLRGFAAGTAAGVFSAGFRDWRRWVLVGGDYTKPNESTGTAAYSLDGGLHWAASAKPPHGYRSSVQWYEPEKLWIAVGTNGSDCSADDGRTWQPLDNGNWNALSLPFVVGPEGRIARLDRTALSACRAPIR